MSDLYQRLSTVILAGNEAETPPLVRKALAQNLPPKDILDHGLIVGMDEVSARFRRGEMFVPEVLTSARAMHAGLELLRPQLAASGTKLAGKIVMGTVQGDLHDIGKNLVSMMCEGAGFEVIDLGFSVPPQKFIAAVKELQPDIVGMSALLTTTMRAMAHTIRALEAAGLRDGVKVMVGGAPLDAAFAQRIGAVGYGSNAVAGVEMAKRLVGLV